MGFSRDAAAVKEITRRASRASTCEKVAGRYVAVYGTTRRPPRMTTRGG